MKHTRIFSSFWIYALALLAGCAVNAALAVSSFERAERDALLRRLLIHGQNIARKIDASLLLGKRIYDMEAQIRLLFADVTQTESAAAAISLYELHADSGAYSLLFSGGGKPEYTAEKAASPAVSAAETYDIVRLGKHWGVRLALDSPNNDFDGTLELMLDTEWMKAAVKQYAARIALFGAAAAVLSLVCLGFCLRIRSAKARTAVCLLIVFACQGAFSAFHAFEYNRLMLQVFTGNCGTLALSLGNMLSGVIAYAQRYPNITGVSEFLQSIAAGNIECSQIIISDAQGSPLFCSGGVLSAESAAAPYVQTMIRDVSGASDAAWRLCVYSNGAYIRALLLAVLQNAYIVTAVSCVFSFICREFVLFLRSRRRLALPGTHGPNLENALSLVWVTVFITVFAGNLSVSFVPPHIQIVCEQSAVSWLPTQAAESLPAGSYLLGILGGLLLTLFVLRKRNVRERLCIFALLFCVGNVLCACLYSLWGLTAARCISGIGYGGVLFSLSALVLGCTAGSARGAGFAVNAASGAAASFAAISVGGEIADKWGYRAGFICCAVCMAAAALFAARFVPRVSAEKDGGAAFGPADVVSVLRMPHIWLYALCINVPFQCMYWGLFQLILPLYMHDTLGLSTQETGALLGVFSLVSIASGAAGRAGSGMKHSVRLLSVGAACAGGALLCLGLFSASLAVCIAALVCMGVHNLFIDALEENYISSGCGESDEETTLLSYRAAEKVISVFIPTCITVCAAAFGVSSLFAGVGLCLLAGAAVFIKTQAAPRTQNCRQTRG